MEENKLQIRAKILTAITEINNNFNDYSVVQEILEQLKPLSEIATALNIVLKEFLNENSVQHDAVLQIILNEVFSRKNIESQITELLLSPTIKDKSKVKLVNLLRDYGNYIKYEDYSQYFTSPDEIIDSDTNKLLENAMINPESQVDFLDFMQALPDEEKLILIESLSNDYQGDELANLLIPMALSTPYTEHGRLAIKTLGESSSLLAYPVLKLLQNCVDDDKTQSVLDKAFSILRFSGIKEDLTKEYYTKMLASYPPYKCLMNFPDGHGNSGIIFSRKNDDGLIKMFAVVINETNGIVDCFGFNEITDAELDRILNKFYQNDKSVDISPESCRYFLENAEKLTREQYEEISYEYTAWKSLIYDIDFENFNEMKEVINKLEKINLTEELLQKLYNTNYLDKWFFEQSDNEEFKNLTQKLLDSKNSDVLFIEQTLDDLLQKIFNPDYVKTLNNRLNLAAYLAYVSLDEISAALLHSLSLESEIKEKFFKDILKRSVYDYFLSLKEKYENAQKTESIFTRKSNTEAMSIDIEFVNKVIAGIEEKWV